jgi:hypothetical protein
LVEQVNQGAVTLSKPVFNVGMPKVGSTTLFSFFRCSGWNASHAEEGKVIKPLLREKGMNNATAILKDILTMDAYLEVDTNWGRCAYPQIEFLDELHAAFPNATFVLNFRPIKDWIKSATNWKDLVRRWANNCQVPGLHCTGIQKDGSKECLTEDLYRWWCSHVQHIREFVKLHPSHPLIELDLYNSSETSKVMVELFSSKSSCWGHSNANPKVK